MGKKFVFKSELWISCYTGFKATNLRSFIDILKKIDSSSIFYHIYINLFNYHNLPVYYPNSIAYWLYKNNYILLAEKVSALDPTEFYDLEELRHKLVEILEKNYEEKIKRDLVPFYFVKAEREIIECGYEATTLEEFIEGIKQSSINSIFYHLVTSRIEKKTLVNDYSTWLINIGEAKKAEEINKLDIYTDTLYGIKQKIIKILEGPND